MNDDIAAQLTTIGPHVVVSDDEREWVATWDVVPGLAADLAPFGLEFRVETMDHGSDPLGPDAEMFRLWTAWRSRHPEYVARLQHAVESRMRAAGVAGDPARQVVSAEVCVSRVDDGGDRDYTVSATLPLACDGEHAVFCYMDSESGELDFQ